MRRITMGRSPVETPDTGPEAEREPTTDTTLLLDRYLPRYDLAVVHAEVLRAPPAVCYRAAREIGLLRHPVTRTLLDLRSLPQRLAELCCSVAKQAGAPRRARRRSSSRMTTLTGHSVRPLPVMERIKMRVEHEVDTHSVGLAARLYRLTRGRITRIWHRQVLLLTTRGRRSGRTRTVPLQFFPDGDRMIVVAANSGLPAPPGWYFNLTAHPYARVEVMDRIVGVRAEELSADEAAAFWPRVLRAAPDYAQYPKRTSRRIPLIRLVPCSAE